MGMKLNVGRFTVDAPEEVTVFLIGMRVNKPLRVDKWFPVFTAMPRMLAHLAKNPEAGMLGYQNWFGRTTMMLSYWESAEHLQRFAADPDAPHVAPWRRFMKEVGNDGSVGIWHETYMSRPSDREVIYVNMPAFGLGQAVGATVIGAGLSTAKQRLARDYA